MIKVHDLHKKYGKNEVLKGLSLEVKEKETLVILGRSGAGKSVLLRHLIGLEKPDNGYVLIDGVNITELKQNKLYSAVKDMGMLFQGAALFDSMNIEKNVGFYLERHKDRQTKRFLKKSEIKERVKEALFMVGLENVEEKMPSDLSGGMKKRAALARLIAYRPRILLYDEPTAGLDPITAQNINELIVETQKELKGTSIIVTHDLNSALFIADRLALSENGIISHIAKPETFLKIDDPTIKFFKDCLTHNTETKRSRNE